MIFKLPENKKNIYTKFVTKFELFQGFKSGWLQIEKNYDLRIRFLSWNMRRDKHAETNF